MGGWVQNRNAYAQTTQAVARYSQGRLCTTAYAWSHASTKDWNWWWSESETYREKKIDWCKNPYRIEGFTDARDRARTGGHVGCAGRAKRFGQSWHRVLDCLVDWWSASFVGVARWSADGSAVSQLSEDLRSGTLVGRRCDDALVHLAERSDCDSSCGETDRADGCAMHGLVVSARFHSERQGETWSCRDKGGQ